MEVRRLGMHAGCSAHCRAEGCLQLHAQCRKLHARACTLDAGMTAELNDKSSFSDLCESHDILVPKSFPITSKEALFQHNKE